MGMSDCKVVDAPFDLRRPTNPAWGTKLRMAKPLFAGTVARVIESRFTYGIVVYVATSAGIRSSEFLGEVPPRNACYWTSLYVLDFKCVLNFGEAQPLRLQTKSLSALHSQPRATLRSEPVADERARRSPQEEHAGDVVHRVHGLALAAQIHACPRLPAILVDLKQYIAVPSGCASQHEN